VAAAVFQFGADAMARRRGPATAQLRRNLARVVPDAGPTELDELVRAGLRSYARYWREAFRLPAMDQRAIYQRVNETVVGRELIDAALDRGKGVVLALPHTGNFDVSGIWVVGQYGGFTTVAERLRPESVYRRFLVYREALGFEILPLTGGASPFRALLERLRENRIVCLVGDRDLTNMGIPVTFFGEQTRMPAGPARLAASTGATILIVDNGFTSDGWRLRFHTPMTVADRADVPAATQRLADLFAGDISAHPADWHMLQKLWLADLPSARRQALADDAVREAG